MINNLKEKITATTGSISGFVSILGSWQICHNVCLLVVSLLALIGITVIGMPLFFLTKIAPYLWTAAVVLLIITIIFYFRKKCISYNLIIFNFGVIIAGIPFQKLQILSIYFWIIGGFFVLMSLFLYLKDKNILRFYNEKKK